MCRSPRISARVSSAGGSPRERLLAQLGRAPRNAERRVQRRFVGGVGQRAEPFDVRAVTGRNDELRAEALRFGDDQLDRHALDRDAGRPTLRAVEHGHDRRQRLERGEHGLRVRGRAHDGEVEREIRPAAGIAGELAADSGRDLLQQSSRAVQRHSLARLRSSFALERCEQTLFRLRADAGNGGEPARARSLAELRRQWKRRAPCRSPPCASVRCRAGDPARRGRVARRSRARRARRCGRCPRALSAVRKSRRRSRAAPAPCLPRRARRSAPCVSRIVSAARR